MMPPKSVRDQARFSQIGPCVAGVRTRTRAKVSRATCDDGGVADNPNDTATGQDRATATGPTSDDTPARRPTRGGRSGMRDMLVSMVVLAVGVLVLVGITKGCSFSPGGPSTDASALPTVDVTAELQAAAGQVKFTLREPRLPAGWRANSDAVDDVGPNGAGRAVRVGWLTPADHYLQVSQSDDSALDLVRAAAGGTVRPTGTRTVDGTKWTVYPGVRVESSWVTDLGSERLFITGNGTTDEFRTLAAATLNGRKVAAQGGP